LLGLPRYRACSATWERVPSFAERFGGQGGHATVEKVRLSPGDLEATGTDHLTGKVRLTPEGLIMTGTGHATAT
jgi:hypothetical protein